MIDDSGIIFTEMQFGSEVDHKNCWKFKIFILLTVLCCPTKPMGNLPTHQSLGKLYCALCVQTWMLTFQSFKSQSVYLLIFKVYQDSLGDIILLASQNLSWPSCPALPCKHCWAQLGVWLGISPCFRVEISPYKYRTNPKS